MQNGYIKKIGAALMAGVLALSVPICAAAEGLLVISPAPPLISPAPPLISPAPSTDVRDALNYSREDAVHEITQAASVLLAAAGQSWTGPAAQGAEHTYLRAEDIVLRYDATPTDALVSTTVDRNTLTVTAQADSYTAADGEVITWIPVRVDIGGIRRELTPSADGTQYEAVFTELDATALYTAQVTYRATLSLDETTVLALINRAYEDGTAAIAREEQYAEDLAAHEAGLAKYQKALADYEEADAKYQAYRKALAIYEAEQAAYNEYLAKVAAYEKAVKDYEAYQIALQKYESDYAAYQTKLSGMQAQQDAYNKYMTYLSQVDRAVAKLAVMESIFTPDSAGRTMYATLMGDTVATVVAQKAELVAAGADAVDVDNAGAATEALKALLASYSACGDDESRYRWYSANYTQVKDNFIQLFGCLNSLYKNSLVRTALNMRDRLQRYQQFVCQLYVISTALDDTTSFDPTWQITHNSSNTGGYTVYDRLDSVQITRDTNAASPAGLSWPAYVAPVTQPQLPQAPVKPTAVDKPVKSWTQELTAPTNKPSAVAQPTKPVRSDYTAGEPTQPVESAELQAVMALIREGKLAERDYNGALTFEVETVVARSFDFVKYLPLVTFYNIDRKTICYTTYVEQGEAAIYEGELPSMPADDRCHYVFAGWLDAYGKEVDLSAVEQDMTVYASYEAIPNIYTVTWELMDGVTIREQYEYGKLPVAPDFEKQIFRDGYEYTFVGWATAVRTVTTDATYRAQYRSRLLEQVAHEVVFHVGERQFHRTFAHGVIPTLDDFEKEYFDSTRLYRFVGWDTEPAPLTADAVYTAVFEEQWLLPAGEARAESAMLSETSATLTVTTDHHVVDATFAVRRAQELGRELVISLGGARVTLDTAALRAMPDAAIFAIDPVATDDGMHYRLRVTDSTGRELNGGEELLLELPLAEDMLAYAHLGVYVNGTAAEASRNGALMYVRTTQCGDIAIRPFYRITVENGEGGAVVCDVTEAHVGETVELTLHAEQGWQLVSLDALCAGTDSSATLIGQTLTVPAADVTVRAVFERITYTVSFVSEGRELATATYHYGDTVTPPADPTWTGAVAEGESYTFTGWSPAVVPVTESVVYTAQFTAARLGGSDAYDTGRNSNKLLTVTLPIVACVVVLGVGGVVGVRVWRKKRSN